MPECAGGGVPMQIDATQTQPVRRRRGANDLRTNHRAKAASMEILEHVVEAIEVARRTRG